jgi:hypothetical protein
MTDITPPAENEVWTSLLDDRFLCQVVRTEPYLGKLAISEEGVVLYVEEVGLSYNAQFGPDVEDVRMWQERCVEVVDMLTGKTQVDLTD